MSRLSADDTPDWYAYAASELGSLSFETDLATGETSDAGSSSRNPPPDSTSDSTSTRGLARLRFGQIRTDGLFNR